jgi:hypothetical protein
MTYAIKSKSNGRYNTNGVPMPLIRYPLDATGLNPDNRVVGEIKTLANTQVKAVVPTYGPIYADGLVVVDNLTNIPLVKGIDYSCVQLLQEATLRFGKEIFEVILIKKPDVSSTVRINYQVLGGLFQNNAAGIESLYQAVMNNNTPISWENVLNKPYEYTPTLHNHMLQDVVGFEPLVVALERVRNAITLTDVASFEALIAWVNDMLVLVGTDKANSVHTHPVSDVVDLQTIVNNLQNGKANLTDFNNLAALVASLDVNKASVTGLNTLITEVAALENAVNTQVTTINQALNTKSAIGHGHVVSDITGLQAALDTALNTKANITDVTALTTVVAGKAPLSHIHSVSDVTGLDTTIINLTSRITALEAALYASLLVPITPIVLGAGRFWANSLGQGYSGTPLAGNGTRGTDVTYQGVAVHLPNAAWFDLELIVTNTAPQTQRINIAVNAFAGIWAATNFYLYRTFPTSAVIASQYSGWTPDFSIIPVNFSTTADIPAGTTVKFNVYVAAEINGDYDYNRNASGIYQLSATFNSWV